MSSKPLDPLFEPFGTDPAAGSREIETVSMTTDELARQWYALRAENQRLRAVALKVVSDPLLDNASESWRELRDVLGSKPY